MDSKLEKCQAEMQNTLDMFEVSNAIIANLELRTMRTEDKPMQEIQDLQEETQTDDSLVTQLPSKLHETVCSLKVKNEPYAVQCESYSKDAPASSLVPRPICVS